MKLYANHIPTIPPMEIVPASGKREWMPAGAGRCLPIRMADEAGWWILNPMRFEARWTGGADPAAMTLAQSAASGYLRAPFGFGILTVLLPYVFQTPPGWNLLVRGPANYPKHGIQALEGLVESDWNISTFTMNWKLTAPNVPVVFEAGEPLCQIVPMRRGDLECFKPRIRVLSGEAMTRYKRWRAGRMLPQSEQQGWRGAYTRGRYPDKPKRFEEHQTRLRLREFTKGA
jgi:hypothetical protein